MELIKKRWEERSTKIGLLVAFLGIAKLFFPEFSSIIDQVVYFVGGSAIVIPDAPRT